MSGIDNLKRTERKPPQLSLYHAVGLALSLIERAKGARVAIWMLSGKPTSTKLGSKTFELYSSKMPSCWVGTYDEETTAIDIERDLGCFYVTEGA